MGRIKLGIIVFIILISNSCKVLKNSNSCVIKEEWQKVIYDKSINNYKLSTIELGKFYNLIEFTDCIVKKDGIFKISGFVKSSISDSVVTNSPIFAGHIRKKVFIIDDTIATTNGKGMFSFEISSNHCIVFKQNENVGLCYKLIVNKP